MHKKGCFILTHSAPVPGQAGRSPTERIAQGYGHAERLRRKHDSSQEAHLLQEINNKAQVFLNIVLDEATESKANNEKVRLGMCVIRGNSVVMMEALDRIGGEDRGGR